MNKETMIRLKELAQKATPGPWYQSRFMVRKDGAHVTIAVAGTSDSADSAFIAAFNPVAVLELIGDLEIARTAIEAHQNAAKHRQNRIAELEALLAERATSPVSQMTAHLAAIEEALKVMLDNGLSECYAYDEAVEALTSMKATPANCQDNEGEKA